VSSLSAYHSSTRPLSAAGKSSTFVAAAEGLTNKIAGVRSNIKFQLEKVLYPGVAIGPVQMNDDQALDNVVLSECLVCYLFHYASRPPLLIYTPVSFVAPSHIRASTLPFPSARRTGKTLSCYKSTLPRVNQSASTRQCRPFLPAFLRGINIKHEKHERISFLGG